MKTCSCRDIELLIGGCCIVSDKLFIDKNPVISFHVVDEGIRPQDEADGNLVIDTSEGHQVGIENVISVFCQVVQKHCLSDVEK